MENFSHDRLLQEMYQYVHNTYPQCRGLYFHVTNELKPYPNETQKKFIIRLSQAKQVGVIKGVMDHLFYWDGGLYAFDAKIGKDTLSPEQLEFIENIRVQGGDGWAIKTLKEFKDLFDSIIYQSNQLY